MKEIDRIMEAVRGRTGSDRRARMIEYGTQLAAQNPRKNGEYDIIWVLPVPIAPQKGCLPCEIVIGKRNTEFQPYVAWHCFGGISYAWGAYCQTFEGAFECAMEKWRREMGVAE